MSNNRDETLFCERCGISFLWTEEEQALAQEAHVGAQRPKAPLHCPGCANLLPVDGRTRGLVKWFNPRKRFGFITPTEGQELFAHSSQLKGARRLSEGDLVEFQVEESERGPIAAEIRILKHRAVEVEEKKTGG